MVDLRVITEENFRKCLSIRACVEDESFVDTVVYSLAEAWLYYKDSRPFAIYENDEMIGFVLMYVGEEHYQIINFLIDDAFRGRGLGTEAAKLCIEYLHEKYNAHKISVPVKQEYLAAQRFWGKLGFCSSATVEDGYNFMRLTIS